MTAITVLLSMTTAMRMMTSLTKQPQQAVLLLVVGRFGFKFFPNLTDPSAASSSMHPEALKNQRQLHESLAAVGGLPC